MEALKRRQRRKRRNQILIVSAIIIVVIIVAYGISTLQPDFITVSAHTPAPSALPSVPTIDPTTQILFHWHLHLDIFVNGTPVIVPGDLGHVVDDSEYFAIHTHDTLGIIHLEYSSRLSLTLIQIFEVWGYPNFSPNQLLTYGGQSNSIYINGSLVQFDPNYPLTCHVEIAIVYGTAPSSIPSSFSFGAVGCYG